MQRQRDQEEQENRDVRRKILALAEAMQYDDDIEESAVSQTRQMPQPKAAAAPEEAKKSGKKPAAATVT